MANSYCSHRLFIATIAACAGAVAPAQAMVNQAVVSNAGVDSAACGAPTNPCRTLQVAHNNTVAGGEVDIINSGDFGPVAITKSISIVNDTAGEASVVQPAAGASAISINTGPSGVVHLRGLNIDGRNSAAFGVVISSAATVDIVGCVARRFVNHGIFHGASTGSKVLIDRTITSENANGIVIRPTMSTFVTITRSTMANNSSFGLYVNGALAPQVATVATSVVDSAATRNQQGFHAVTGATQATTKLALNNVMASANAYGVVAATSSVISLAHSLVSDNSVSGAHRAGGTILSLGDNSFRLNAADVSGGALTAYSPK